MRIVVALGGNALLRRGQAMTADNQRDNIKIAAQRIAEVAVDHEIVIAHGNGPQVGLLALQAAGYTDVPAYPLDVLGAETQAQIGYMIEQELGNLLPEGRELATLLTMIKVDRNDPAFANPTKPIGPVYDEAEAKALADERGWTIAPDGDKWRRIVPSPQPTDIYELSSIKTLVDNGTIVICGGGGGIPYAVNDDGTLEGVEAVIDKDLASTLLAIQLHADMLIIATDVDGIYLDWGKDTQRKLEGATPDELESMDFAQGSMGPKVAAACNFARETGNVAVIGSLDDISAIVKGQAGTRVAE